MVVGREKRENGLIWIWVKRRLNPSGTGMKAGFISAWLHLWGGGIRRQINTVRKKEWQKLSDLT